MMVYPKGKDKDKEKDDPIEIEKVSSTSDPGSPSLGGLGDVAVNGVGVKKSLSQGSAPNLVVRGNSSNLFRGSSSRSDFDHVDGEPSLEERARMVTLSPSTL